MCALRAGETHVDVIFKKNYFLIIVLYFNVFYFEVYMKERKKKMSMSAQHSIDATTNVTRKSAYA